MPQPVGHSGAHLAERCVINVEHYHYSNNHRVSTFQGLAPSEKTGLSCWHSARASVVQTSVQARAGGICLSKAFADMWVEKERERAVSLGRSCSEFLAEERPTSTHPCKCEPRASVIRAVVWAACQELPMRPQPFSA